MLFKVQTPAVRCMPLTADSLPIGYVIASVTQTSACRFNNFVQ